MTFIVYLFLYTLSIGFAASATRSSIRTGDNIWNHPSFYGLLIVFSLIVGTRYMVGLDYPEYMNIIQWGEYHHYYNHVEFIPRKIIDIVNLLNLEFYWWFILMAFCQIFFIARAVRGTLVKVFPWIIFCFLVLYLSFYMNVVRQGAALSCFLCAVSYAQERKLWHYLIFFLLGFLCHSSIIVWLPTYWILNRELFPNIKVQYLLFAVSAFVFPSIVTKILDLTRPYWEIFGYAHQADTFTGTEEFESLKFGLGVLLRFFRWSIIIAYYTKMKKCYGSEHFIFLYNLFFIGVCLDYSTMFNMLLARVSIYASFIEIVILAYLFDYLSKSRKEIDKLVYIVLLVIMIVLFLYSIVTGEVWQFVWQISLR